MRKYLGSLTLLLGLAVSTAHAQDNRYWHWFATEKEAWDMALNRPGWTYFDTREAGENKVITFRSDDHQHFASYHLVRNSLRARIYSCAQEDEKDWSWLVGRAEPAGEGRWLDPTHNATITRTYSGMLVFYRIDYTPAPK